MTDPIDKSLTVFSAACSAGGVVCAGIVAAAEVYPDGLPCAEYKPLIKGLGLAAAAFAGSVAAGLSIKSKMRRRKSCVK